MLETLLHTKLYAPPLRPNLVPRLRLIETINQGLQLGHKLTLISAPAGFGKTTLIADFGMRISESFRNPKYFGTLSTSSESHNPKSLSR